MADTKQLEQKLEREQADYLKRLEGAGQLPTAISGAWQKAGGGEQAALRGEEAGLLTDYVSAGATAREKYKDIWDPFARDRLAATQVSQEYAPIADIRKELAMRAEALGIATQSATAMYGAETGRAETSLGFTQSAYSRALEKEQEVRRQKERDEDIARSLAEAAKDRALSRSKSGTSGAEKAAKIAAAEKKIFQHGLGIIDTIASTTTGYQGWEDAANMIRTELKEDPKDWEYELAMKFGKESDKKYFSKLYGK